MSLSVAMMVKNEERHLGRCLNSVMVFAPDEIIVVDTGSTDRTIEIAESYGAKVIIPENLDAFFVRTGYGKKLNFAKTRNYSMSFCSGSWILQIDADETITPYGGQGPERLRGFISRLPDDVDCVGFLMEDIRSDRQQRIKMNAPRLFRNGKVHFTGIVHNEPHWPGRGAYYPFARMYHYGYDLKGKAKQEKGERLCGLLEVRIAQNPNDYDAMFYLAQAYGVHDQPEKSVEWGEKYAALLPQIIAEGRNHYGVVHYLLATTYLNMGDLNKAQQWLSVGLQYAPGDIDLSWTLLRMGIKAQDPNIIMSASRSFVMAYEKFASETTHETSRVVFNHNPGCYALALYYSTMTMLETAHTSLTKLDGILPRIPDDLQSEIMGGTQSVMENLDLKWGKARHLVPRRKNVIITPSGMNVGHKIAV